MSEHYQQSLLLLKAAYVKRLEGKMPEWTSLLTVFRSNAPLPDHTLLTRDMHNFAGSGTTFGFPTITHAARELYHILKDDLDPESPLTVDSGTRQRIVLTLQRFLQSCRDTVAGYAGSDEHEQTQAAPTGSIALVGARHLAIIASRHEVAEELALQLGHFGYHVTLHEDGAALGGGPLPYAVIVCGHPSDAWLFPDHMREMAALGGAELPIVLIAPGDDFDMRLHAAKAGAQGYFRETDDMLKILDKIEQLASKYATSPAYRVLIVEDDEMLAEFYSHTLENVGMIVRRCSHPKDVISMLENSPADLLLIDFTMPYCTGEELAAVIRQHEQYVSLPIIFMSAKEEAQALVMGTGLGIDDFLVKPFLPETLISVVGSRARRAAELQSFMIRDSFTGLLNHAYFLETLGVELMNVQRYKHETVYAMLDIDHFKRVNDRFGHAAGDQVLKSLARMLQQRLRRSDIVGRCGGEEFGIIMPRCGLDNAGRILESLRSAFAEVDFTLAGQQVNVTFSGGLTVVTPEMTLDQLISTADASLYRAKEAGRNRLIVAAA